MGLGISASACGRCHACACVFVCICMRIHTCVGIYICTFFLCSECYMYFTGVVGTCVWAGVYITQVCFYTNVHICDTLAAGCAHNCICIKVWICMYMHKDAYVRLWYCLTRWSVVTKIYICAYVCICMRMYMCVHVCVYRCMCICMYMYICMSVYMYEYTFIYARVWVYICTRVGAFCLFVLSNLSTTCACITGVS